MMKVKETSPAYLAKRKPFTYHDYLELPEDGKWYQVINGELVMTPAPRTIHQDVLLNLAEELRQFLRKKKIGKIYVAAVDVVLSETNVVQPDILFISKENFSIISDDNITGVPNLVVEILSPSTAYYDLVEKKEIYEKFGVQEYWIIDPKKQWIEVYTNPENKFQLKQRLEKSGTLESEVLAGFEVSVEKIFQWD